MDIKVIVATHKTYEMPEEGCYIPVQVGASLSVADLGYQKDNEGDNISYKNKNYCELTAIYWGWKNLECDAVGLVHYRRYFTNNNSKNINSVLKKSQFTELLKECDIILPKKRDYFIETNYSHYINSHHKQPLDETRNIILKKYPNYVEAFDKVMESRKAHMFNMFVMKKECFDKYCEWLFDILFELESRIDISTYDSYESRVYGFVSELLLNVWLYNQNYKVKVQNWTHMEDEKVIEKAIAMIKRKILNKNKLSGVPK